MDDVVSYDLNPPIRVRYIRFLPVTWDNYISMRVELYGCIQGLEDVLDKNSLVLFDTSLPFLTFSVQA